MKKEYLYIVILILAIVGVLYGIIGLLNTRYNIEENQSNIKNENLYYENENVISTSSKQEKISPNCKFALKKYYDECSHFEYEEAELPKELVNLTRKEVEEYYKDWKIENFSENNLVLSKEINGYCDQHFIVKAKNRIIEIYRIDTLGKLNEYKDTGIAIDYLPEDDIKKLENGIPIYGEGNLSSVLEDYE